jgi:glucose/mannose-6-phosphate isomerase
MNSVLDDPEYIKQNDPNEMLQVITDFPKNALKVIENIDKVRIKIHEDNYDSILVAGMGGSAVGGLLLRDWLIDTIKVPLVVNRAYHLPAWVNDKTLVYAVSYSGNTEETISQYMEAIEQGCTVICFCSGGILEEKAKENENILVKFPKGQQPRAAIAFQFYNLAGVTRRIGLISDVKWGEVIESIKIVETHCREMNPRVPMESNKGKKLARDIRGYVPFIYAPSLFMNVAYRYSTQFNENSKSPSATNFYPEAFHNSVMAREAGKKLLERLCAVIIKDPLGDSRLNKKTDFSIELMKETFGKVVTVEAEGKSNLARIMSTLIQGDYASAYLGLLYGIDPNTTESINILKSRMKN